MTVEVRPVSPERIDDLTRFSSANGSFGYCSCMKWRLTSTGFKNSDKAARARMLTDLVEGGQPVGLLGYLDGEPVGWCSIAPREHLAGLERYRKLPRIDETPVWAVVCFYVHRSARGRGVQKALLRAAVEYARSHGAVAVEGYPPPASATLYRYMGSIEVFTEAGFTDVTPARQERPVLRYVLR
jgi:GNAT superfamily N-acetyltransferase